MIQKSRAFLGQIFQSETFRSISTLMGANLANGVIGFFSSMIVLRHMDPSSIGMLYPLIGILMISEQCGDLGLSTALIKVASPHTKAHPAHAARLYQTALFSKTILASVVSITCFLIAPLINRWLFKDEQAVVWIRLIAGLSFFSVLSTFFQAVLQIENRFNLLALARVLPNVLKIALLATALLSNRLSFPLVLGAHLVVSLGCFVLAAVIVVHIGKVQILSWPRHFKKDFSEIFDTAKWILVSTITVSLMGQIDVFCLKTMRGGTEIARYMAGSRLASAFLMMTSSIVTVLFPKVTSFQSRQQLRSYLFKVIAILSPVPVMTLAIIPFIPKIIHLTLGPAYQSASNVFVIMSIQFALDLFITPVSLVVYALNRTSVFSWMNFSQLILFSAANYLLVPRFGAEGAAASGMLIRVFAVLVVSFVLFQEKVITLSFLRNNRWAKTNREITLRK